MPGLVTDDDTLDVPLGHQHQRLEQHVAGIDADQRSRDPRRQRVVRLRVRQRQRIQQVGAREDSRLGGRRLAHQHAADATAFHRQSRLAQAALRMQPDRRCQLRIGDSGQHHVVRHFVLGGALPQAALGRQALVEPRGETLVTLQRLAEHLRVDRVAEQVLAHHVGKARLALDHREGAEHVAGTVVGQRLLFAVPELQRLRLPLDDEIHRRRGFARLQRPLAGFEQHDVAGAVKGTTLPGIEQRQRRMVEVEQRIHRPLSCLGAPAIADPSFSSSGARPAHVRDGQARSWP